MGPGSDTMAKALDRLSGIYRQSSTAPPVAACYNHWRLYREAVRSQADSSPSVFLRHTYLALLVRLAARHFLEPPRRFIEDGELWQVVNGDYFLKRGLENFAGEDFFTWPYFQRSHGFADDADAMGLAGEMSAVLAGFDLSDGPLGLLPLLYHRTECARTECEGGVLGRPLPRWVVEYLVHAGLGLPEHPDRSVLDPSCGPGALLAAAVDSAVRATMGQGRDEFDTLLLVAGRIAGMTADPLEAAVARTNYLFALRDLARLPHPPILVPVYLADAAATTVSEDAAGGVPAHRFPQASDLPLPDRVAADPMMLEWLFGRLPNYMRGAAARLRAQPEEDAIQEVLNAYYNYLTSPKVRTPIPEPLTPAAADVMIDTARQLVRGYLRGEGHARLHLIRNAPAPLFLARRGFDVVASCGPGASPATGHEADIDLFEECLRIYLNPTGRSAAVFAANAQTEFTCYMAGAGDPLGSNSVRLTLRGTPPAGDPGWEEMKDRVDVIAP